MYCQNVHNMYSTKCENSGGQDAATNDGQQN